MPLCHWSSQLFDLRAPSSADVPVLLLNQPIVLGREHGGRDVMSKGSVGSIAVKLNKVLEICNNYLVHGHFKRLRGKLGRFGLELHCGAILGTFLTQSPIENA